MRCPSTAQSKPMPSVLALTTASHDRGQGLCSLRWSISEDATLSWSKDMPSPGHVHKRAPVSVRVHEQVINDPSSGRDLLIANGQAHDRVRQGRSRIFSGYSFVSCARSGRSSRRRNENGPAGVNRSFSNV